MGFRFRKTISLLPGVRINMSKSGPSVSVGGKGSTINFGKKGTKTTFGLPGSGMSYSSYKRYGEGEAGEGPHANSAPRRTLSIVPIIIVALVFYVIYQGGGLTSIVKSKVVEATDAVKSAPEPSPTPVAPFAFTVSSDAAKACGLPYPCNLQPILDSTDWPDVSAALATAIKAGGDGRVEWTGTIPARHGYVKRGKPLASGDCTGYAIAARAGDKTVIRHVKLCNRAGGPPEMK